MKIRTARIETDLASIVQIINPYETKPVTVDQVRSFFLFNPPGRIQLRLVAVDENEAVIGYSGFIHEASAPDHHFVVWVIVDPAYRGQGIGSGLWNTTLDSLRGQGASKLASDVFDNDHVGLGFANRRGFSIDRHSFDSILDLAVFDETSYLPGIAALEAQGMRFCSLADFPDTSETRRKLYDLNVTNELDIPGTNNIPFTYPEFETFVLRAAWFRREGQLLAVNGDDWVGLAAVSITPETQSAYNEHTGVLRAYRGRKIAQALKVLAVRYARQNGERQIRTDNDSLNMPILAINRKMGYQPQPGKYKLVCWLAGTE